LFVEFISVPGWSWRSGSAYFLLGVESAVYSLAFFLFSPLQAPPFLLLSNPSDACPSVFQVALAVDDLLDFSLLFRPVKVSAWSLR